MMGGDGGVDEVTAEAPKARKGPVLVGAGEPAVADDVGDQNSPRVSGFPAMARPRALRKCGL